MDGVTAATVITVAILGVLVGAFAVAAFTLSDRSYHHLDEDAQVPAPVHPEVLSVLTALAGIAIVVDADNRVLRADAQAHALVLVRDDQLCRDELVELVDRVRRSGLTERQEMEFTRSSCQRFKTAQLDPRGGSSGAGQVPGAKMCLDIRAAALLGGKVVILGHDVSQERRLDAVRRDFTANVSHELKTPVGAITLLSETIAQHAQDPQAVRMFAPKLNRESQRLAALVQDIIDLSRLQGPDALADAQLVDLCEVVSEAVDRQLTAAEQARITLLVDFKADGGAFAWGSHDLLTTAVRNLVDNAIRYSPPDSTVRINLEVGDDLVRISVIDTGIGMEAEHLDRIFERFYRVDPARSRSTGGTGLGLSIVKHVAADHGGTVSVWSRPGRGSTFTLVLPAASDTERTLP